MHGQSCQSWALHAAATWSQCGSTSGLLRVCLTFGLLAQGTPQSSWGEGQPELPPPLPAVAPGKPSARKEVVRISITQRNIPTFLLEFHLT